ncbi:hypothetical protein PYCC9005_006012 [Savitreella phatthalungensis]
MPGRAPKRQSSLASSRAFDSFRVAKRTPSSGSLKDVIVNKKATSVTDLRAKAKAKSLESDASASLAPQVDVVDLAEADERKPSPVDTPALSREASSRADSEAAAAAAHEEFLDSLPSLDERNPALRSKMEDILSERSTPLFHVPRPQPSEIILRDFDLSGKYGPCVGITRQQRYDRALKLGMNPPPEVGQILATRDAHERDSLKHDLFYGRL